MVLLLLIILLPSPPFFLYFILALLLLYIYTVDRRVRVSIIVSLIRHYHMMPSSLQHQNTCYRRDESYTSNKLSEEYATEQGKGTTCAKKVLRPPCTVLILLVVLQE